MASFRIVFGVCFTALRHISHKQHLDKRCSSILFFFAREKEYIHEQNSPRVSFFHDVVQQ